MANWIIVEGCTCPDCQFARLQLTRPLTEVPSVSNPKQLYGDKKCPLQLVPPALEIAASKGLAEGAPKYGPFNWRSTKVNMTTYIGAMKRHLAAMADGEDVDPEAANGKLHLEGLAANIAILADAWYGGFLIDDRPPPGPAPRLLLTPKQQAEQLTEYKQVGLVPPTFPLEDLED